MRLVDADELDVEYYGLYRHGLMAVKAVLHVFVNLLNKQPTIDPVHAAGGCYCRECKFYYEHRTRKNKQIMRWCMKRDGAEFHVKPDDFCSYGRRREDA